MHRQARIALLLEAIAGLYQKYSRSYPEHVRQQLSWVTADDVWFDDFDIACLEEFYPKDIETLTEWRGKLAKSMHSERENAQGLSR